MPLRNGTSRVHVLCPYLLSVPWHDPCSAQMLDLQSTADKACALQYTSQAAQRYRQQLEKDAAKLSALPKPEALLDAPAPVANPAVPTSNAAPPSTSATTAPLAAAAAPASSNGRAVPEENGAVEKAPAPTGALLCFGGLAQPRMCFRGHGAAGVSGQGSHIFAYPQQRLDIWLVLLKCLLSLSGCPLLRLLTTQ